MSKSRQESGGHGTCGFRAEKKSGVPKPPNQPHRLDRSPHTSEHSRPRETHAAHTHVTRRSCSALAAAVVPAAAYPAVWPSVASHAQAAALPAPPGLHPCADRA